MSAKYAHSPSENNPDVWHDLNQHTQSVANECGRLALKFNQQNIGIYVGYYHDAGKYTDSWQTYLNHSHYGIPTPKVNHAFYGAINVIKNDQHNLHLGNIIAGHHSGLKNIQNLSSIYKEKQDCVNEDYFLKDTKDFVFEKDPISLSPLNVRMLFSCLIDADRKDTESFYKPHMVKFRADKKYKPIFGDNYLSHINSFPEPQSELNKIRKKVSESCKSYSTKPTGFFSLTSPTGVGKTLASLNFAVNHIEHNKLDRLVNTIPFTSIIDQMSIIYKNIFHFSNVLEHHSNIIVDEQSDNKKTDFFRKINSENWNSPFILTTTVQFFDSLFSNRPNKLRKLHNYANSLIILDEPQMLPMKNLMPLVDKLKDLVKNYNCSVLFCTATPFDYDFLGIQTQEICDDYEAVFKALKRVKYSIINDGHQIEINDLINEIKNHEQALCIVNTKKDALEIFGQFEHLDYAFHLSTNMTPKHRKEVIKQMSYNLQNKLPCLVIATQLIECGVDVDFPVVFRSLAPLPSIVQSAGRCNREGKLKFGNCFVFRYGSYPDDVYKSLAETTLNFLKDNSFSIDEPRICKKYFKDIHDRHSSSEHEVFKHENEYKFEDAAEFKLIDEETFSVIADIDDSFIDDLKIILSDSEGLLNQTVRQKIQNNSVSLRSYELKNNTTIIHEDFPDIKAWKHGYDSRTGIIRF